MSSSAPSPPFGAPPPEPPLPAPPEFYCYECAATVSLPADPLAPRPRLCPRCHSDFIEESPSTPSPPPPPLSPPPPPPPPPPPLLFSGSSSSSLSDDPEDDDLDFIMDPDEARAYLSRLVHRHRLRDDNGGEGGPFDVAAAAAVSVLQQHGHVPVHGRRHGPLGGGGEPPATAASIAALPTVEVAEPAAVCAICKDDLPLASEARKLPCAHLYHSFCIVTWLEMHNSCPVCRFRIPSSSAEGEAAAPSEQDPQPPTTRITIRFTTTTRRRLRVGTDAALAAAAAAPISASPTQLAQAITGDGAGGPANSGETVSSEWPPHPESDTVMSEAREGDGFFD